MSLPIFLVLLNNIVLQVVLTGLLFAFGVAFPLAAAEFDLAAAEHDCLPDGGVAQHGEWRAWYAGPTDRYRHAILGDDIEASRLVVHHASTHQTLSYSLPDTSVFEDLTPRWVDVDQDGQFELLTIKAYAAVGATLALYGLGEEALVPLGEAPAIGRSFRWLNPAGVADFDGDGQQEIAVIETPHIGGKLVLYHWDKAQRVITEERRTLGYSTHAIGARELDLMEVVDWTGDGVMDLVLPRQNRQTIAVVSMADGSFEEVYQKHLPDGIKGPITLEASHVLIPLHSGTVYQLPLPQ